MLINHQVSNDEKPLMSFWLKSETSKEDQIEKMSQVIPKLVSAVETNQERLDTSSDIFRQEYGLWKCQKKPDFKNMLTALAESHIQYYQHVSQFYFVVYLMVTNNFLQCVTSWDLVFKNMAPE